MNTILVAVASIFIVCAVFLPSPDLLFGLPLRYEDLLAAVGGLLAIVALLARKQRRLRLTRAAASTAMIALGLAAAIMLSAAMPNSAGRVVSAGLALELLRLSKYAAVVVLASIIPRRRTSIIVDVIIIAGVGIVSIQLAQLLSNAFNERFVELYGNARHLRASLASGSDETVRYYGATLENPNVTGLFLLLPLCLSIGRLVTRRRVSPERRTWLRHRLAEVVVFVVPIYLFLGIVLTRSRATFASVFVAMVVFAIVGPGRRSNRILIPRRALPMALLLVSFFVVPMYLRFGYAGLEPGDFAEGVTSGSLAVKFRLFQETLSEMTPINYMVGLGPHNGVNVDFEYGYVFEWYGLLGVAVFAVMWWWIAIQASRLDESSVERRILLAVVAGLLTMNISQTSFFVSRLFPIFLITFVLLVRRGCVLPYRLGTRARSSAALTGNAIEFAGLGGGAVTWSPLQASENSGSPLPEWRQSHGGRSIAGDG